MPSVSNSQIEYLNNTVCNSFYISPVTCSEIETISLISVFSKLLEKLVYNRLIKFSEKKQSYLKINMVSELSTVQTMQFFA